jgi:hypothetical protein
MGVDCRSDRCCSEWLTRFNQASSCEYVVCTFRIGNVVTNSDKTGRHVAHVSTSSRRNKEHDFEWVNPGVFACLVCFEGMVRTSKGYES